MRPRFFICALAIVTLAAEAKAVTVRVAVPTLSMVVIAFTAAKEKGYYRDEGLDVDLVVMRDTLGISALIGASLPHVIQQLPLTARWNSVMDSAPGIRRAASKSGGEVMIAQGRVNSALK